MVDRGTIPGPRNQDSCSTALPFTILIINNISIENSNVPPRQNYERALRLISTQHRWKYSRDPISVSKFLSRRFYWLTAKWWLAEKWRLEIVRSITIYRRILSRGPVTILSTIRQPYTPGSYPRRGIRIKEEGQRSLGKWGRKITKDRADRLEEEGGKEGVGWDLISAEGRFRL